MAVAEEARVQSPGLLAVVQTSIQRLTLLDFGAQLGLVLSVGNANLNQMVNIDSGSGQDEVALVNGALGETLQIFRCLNG